MKAVATLETEEDIRDSGAYAPDSILQFQEGLIGFRNCKKFVLLESEGISPFRRLQSTERADVGFLVLDPTYVAKDYLSLIPEREWQSIEVEEAAARLAFVICIIGPTPAESTGNLQAPLIINYANMTGRQVILSDIAFSSRQPLV
jgi:flagellar assembly factor FliW